MAWRGLGRFTVGPTDGEITLGPITVPAYNGVEVRVRQVSPSQGFRFAYGLLSFVSDAGARELGSVKFWAGAEAADYRLGLGLLSEGSGVLKFEPRNYNLRWIKAGFPWELEFWVDEAATGGGAGGGGGGTDPDPPDPVVNSFLFASHVGISSMRTTALGTISNPTLAQVRTIQAEQNWNPKTPDSAKTFWNAIRIEPSGTVVCSYMVKAAGDQFALLLGGNADSAEGSSMVQVGGDITDARSVQAWKAVSYPDKRLYLFTTSATHGTVTLTGSAYWLHYFGAP